MLATCSRLRYGATPYPSIKFENLILPAERAFIAPDTPAILDLLREVLHLRNFHKCWDALEDGRLSNIDEQLLFSWKDRGKCLEPSCAHCGSGNLLENLNLQAEHPSLDCLGSKYCGNLIRCSRCRANIQYVDELLKYHRTTLCGDRACGNGTKGERSRECFVKSEAKLHQRELEQKSNADKGKSAAHRDERLKSKPVSRLDVAARVDLFLHNERVRELSDQLQTIPDPWRLDTVKQEMAKGRCMEPNCPVCDKQSTSRVMNWLNEVHRECTDWWCCEPDTCSKCPSKALAHGERLRTSALPNCVLGTCGNVLCLTCCTQALKALPAIYRRPQEQQDTRQKKRKADEMEQTQSSDDMCGEAQIGLETRLHDGPSLPAERHVRQDLGARGSIEACVNGPREKEIAIDTVKGIPKEPGLESQNKQIPHGVVPGSELKLLSTSLSSNFVEVCKKGICHKRRDCSFCIQEWRYNLSKQHDRNKRIRLQRFDCTGPSPLLPYNLGCTAFNCKRCGMVEACNGPLRENDDLRKYRARAWLDEQFPGKAAIDGRININNSDGMTERRTNVSTTAV